MLRKLSEETAITNCNLMTLDTKKKKADNKIYLKYSRVC